LNKILIANRGEIAVRLIRACQESGLDCVAVYSDADASSLHVRLAPEALHIGPAPAAESYLDTNRLLAAARAAGADALHPGYGFLSENPAFAEAVAAAGLTFIGPPPEAMRAMGDKVRARALMEQAGVPVVPGFEGGARADFTAAAGRLGYPVLVKAAAGGGGRGMRVVRDPADLAEALAAARREAAGAFGDDRVFLEKYVERGRHIEFQVFGDSHGAVVHLFERECSVQRRHQKVIEEAPSPLLELHPGLRARMGAAAVAAARAAGYANAGTVEFIVDPDTLEFYFLEMNARLQVEHPVTEAVTGLDLVRLQFLVAGGQPLPFAQDDVRARGHAIECRVYAEDPAQGFLPSIGRLLRVAEPRGPGVRVDSGYASGDEVSRHYDALLAKVIAAAPGRGDALARMDAALARCVVLGVTTNLTFLRAILTHPEFQAGTATTRFVETRLADWQPPAAVPDDALIAAALFDALAARAGPGVDSRSVAAAVSPWQAADGFRLGGG
jgi:acetyl-CoA carboxylase biotin carboxylase subunit